jgi:hypothetical protein
MMVTTFAIGAKPLRMSVPALPVPQRVATTGVSKKVAAATRGQITLFPFGIMRKIAGAAGAVGIRVIVDVVLTTVPVVLLS